MEQFLSFKQVYSDQIEKSIGNEFHRTQSQCYLDNVGAALYSEKQIENVFKELSGNLFTNPHARNTSSKCTEDAIDIARQLILEHFNANSEEYSVIFTSGATESLRIVAEHFDYKDATKGTLAYLQNNHTSALGMRAYAENNRQITVDEAFKVLSKQQNGIKRKNDHDNYNCLFVYPAQSNFCGTKYPLEWVETVKNGALNIITNCNTTNWFVLLDIATHASTNILDLSKCKPDFITLSFYKIFGYPTGLGALIVKRSAEKLLKVKYLGGGTVLMALSADNVMIPRPIINERFESGTLPFLSILSIRHGLETFKRLNLNFKLISQHTFSLAQYTYRNLLVLHHQNGQPLVKLYHSTTFEGNEYQGGIVTFNLLRSNGQYIGYSEVLHFACLYGIQLRTGCFCNPGACQMYLNLSTEDVRRHFDAGHVCGDQHDLVNGHPTGAVRISFGYTSTKNHADKFLDMIKTCFVDKVTVKMPSAWETMQTNFKRRFLVDTPKWNINDVVTPTINTTNSTDNCDYGYNNHRKNVGILKKVYLFPIKSCGAFCPDDKWELTATGLKYDRQWMIVNGQGVCVTQKQIKKLCLIKPVVDLSDGVLLLNYEGHKSISIPLINNQVKLQQVALCQSKVCGDKIQGVDCGDEVAQWLSQVLKVSGLRLLQQYQADDQKSRTSKKGEHPQLSLSNKAQYLLVNYFSIEWLRSKIPSKDFTEEISKTVDRFRPNLLVDLGEPFQETEYDGYLIDDLKFMSGGKCTRCQMICIDQSTGDVSKEPLASLSREFQGLISFGIYLNQEDSRDSQFICLGSDVVGFTLSK